MMLLRVAVPFDSCAGAFGSGFIHILILKFQLPSRLERSLWLSLSFDSSIICFIISCGFGWPVAVAGWAALVPDAVAGDVAGVWANEDIAINVANRIAINEVKVFMVRSLAVIRGDWQATTDFGYKNLTTPQNAGRKVQNATRKSDD